MFVCLIWFGLAWFGWVWFVWFVWFALVWLFIGLIVCCSVVVVLVGRSLGWLVVCLFVWLFGLFVCLFVCCLVVWLFVSPERPWVTGATQKNEASFALIAAGRCSLETLPKPRPSVSEGVALECGQDAGG